MLVFGGVDGRILTKSWSILDLSLDHPCFFQTSEREFLRVVLSHLEGERPTPTKKRVATIHQHASSDRTQG